MSLVVQRYALKMDRRFTIRMPAGAEILHGEPHPRVVSSLVDDSEKPMLWALVDPSRPMTDFEFGMVSTGEPIPRSWEAYRHVATLTWWRGQVTHLFQIPNSAMAVGAVGMAREAERRGADAAILRQAGMQPVGSPWS